MSKKTKSNNPSVPAASQGRETLSTVLVTVGLLAIMVAAVLPLLRVAQDWARYLYAAGAVILLVGRFVAPASSYRDMDSHHLHGRRCFSLPSLRRSKRLDSLHPCRWFPHALHLNHDSASETGLKTEVLLAGKSKNILICREIAAF